MRSRVTIAILAGGRSSRFGGRDKQELLYEGEMLGRRVARQALALGVPVVVAGSNPRPYAGMGLNLVRDEAPGFGPISGLYTALGASTRPWVYLIACDMPLMEAAWLDSLLALAAKGEAEGVQAIAALRGEDIEPFHALYARTLLPELTSLFSGPRLDPRQYSFSSLIRRVKRILVPEEIVRQSSPDWGIFRGINDPGELLAFSPSQGLPRLVDERDNLLSTLE